MKTTTKKPAAKPMSYKKGGMVRPPMHKMPNGKMMPGAKHGATKARRDATGRG
jgi:hypothetical protein